MDGTDAVRFIDDPPGQRYITDSDTGKVGPSVAGCVDWEACRELERRAAERIEQAKRKPRAKPTAQLDLFGADATGNLVLEL